jgi:hypothetical protein
LQLFAWLPTTADLSSAPERAILAALDASLLLGIRALKAAHPTLEDPDADSGNQPLLLAGESILGTATCLHEMLADYDKMLDRLAGRDRSAAPRTPAPADRIAAADIPF